MCSYATLHSSGGILPSNNSKLNKKQLPFLLMRVFSDVELLRAFIQFVFSTICLVASNLLQHAHKKTCQY